MCGLGTVLRVIMVDPDRRDDFMLLFSVPYLKYHIFPFTYGSCGVTMLYECSSSVC